jgi:acetolactate synthase-1/2/3 large subunit
MVQALYEATGGDAIVTSDVGQHQMWAAQYFHFREPRGGSTPAAWARWASACPRRWARRSAARRDVVCITGDGSFQMNIQELATCAEDGIAVKVFIMNNGYLGMVRQWQELFWDRRYSHVDDGQLPRLRQARRGLRRDRHALHGQEHARRRHARRRSRPTGPVVVDVASRRRRTSTR